MTVDIRLSRDMVTWRVAEVDSIVFVQAKTSLHPRPILLFIQAIRD
jgi:hypothetical protein